MNEWMILDLDNKSLLPITSILQISMKSEGGVVSEPIEMGSFVAYNKTTSALDFTVELGFEGTNPELMSVLDKLKELKESTELFSLVTPYREFDNLTLKSFDTKLERTGGLGSLQVSCSIVEIRELGEEYNAADPSDHTTVNSGLTSTTKPTAKQLNEAKKAKMHVLAQKLRNKF